VIYSIYTIHEHVFICNDMKRKLNSDSQQFHQYEQLKNYSLCIKQQSITLCILTLVLSAEDLCPYPGFLSLLIKIKKGHLLHLIKCTEVNSAWSYDISVIYN
jgi:hypothetical protein